MVIGLLCWTGIVWLLALAGAHGLAIVAAFGALLHGTWFALASLRRDRRCHVCGQSYGVGTLGMCGSCAGDVRVRG